jgi:monoamine oxidase
MARTALARTLQRIAAEHRSADAGGPIVEPVPNRALNAAVTPAQAVQHGRQAAGATPPRIAIVGAGISGLAAALRLQDSGVSSTVYEADSRVGGRMHSHLWPNGQVSEWGGELIDSRHAAMHALARRFDLPLDDLVGAAPPGSEPTYSFGGRYYPFTSASSDFAPVHEALKEDSQTFTWPVAYDSTDAGGIALSDLSLSDWIDRRVPGGHASPLGALIDLAYTVEYGGQTSDQTALNLLALLGYQPSSGAFSLLGLSDERYHIRGGNAQLPMAMAAALTHPVKTGWRLTALVRSSDGTQSLTFDVDGSTTTVSADHTVLAVPLGVLQRLDLSRAGFDDRKLGQIAGMRMGRNSKLHVQFTRRGWNSPGPWPGVSSGETYADTGYQNTWEVTRGQPGPAGILVNYTGGDCASAFDAATAFSTQDSARTTDWARTFLARLEPVLPGVAATWNGQASLSAWHLNPYSWGSYSYSPVGYSHKYAGYEAARQGAVHFAGEHTSVEHQGYMEGAAIEGPRAAEEILADLGLP